MIKEFTEKDIFIIMTPEGWYACFLPGVLYYIRHIKELNNITICKAKKLSQNSKKQTFVGQVTPRCFITFRTKSTFPG